MNSKIVCIYVRIVVVGRPYVIVDGSNVYHDNVCKSHSKRLCSECQINQETCSEHGTRLCKKCRNDMKKSGLIKWAGNQYRANTSYDPNWNRTLDISRLVDVDSRISMKGYHPLIYIYWSTHDYMLRNVEKYSELGPKIDVLDDLDKRARLVKFDPGKPPGVDKEDDPNWDDDVWIILTAIELEKTEGVDCYIMSKDGFKKYREKGSRGFIQFEWSWEKIDDRKIDFSWIPKSNIDENETQTLVSPKLEKLNPVEQTIETEYHLREAKIRFHEQELKLLKEQKQKADLSAQIDTKKIEKDNVLPEILLESQEEQFVNPLKEFQKDVQTAVWWVTEYKMDGEGGIKSIDIWLSLKKKIIPNFADIDGSDEYLKEKLGFSANTEIITILEYAVLIYQDSTGIELKFSPDQELLTVIQ